MHPNSYNKLRAVATCPLREASGSKAAFQQWKIWVNAETLQLTLLSVGICGCVRVCTKIFIKCNKQVCVCLLLENWIGNAIITVIIMTFHGIITIELIAVIIVVSVSYGCRFAVVASCCLCPCMHYWFCRTEFHATSQHVLLRTAIGGSVTGDCSDFVENSGTGWYRCSQFKIRQ